MADFFANASVSAFIGAFSAFVLVIVTDRRRLYHKRSILKNVISDNGDHARFKLDTVQRNLEIIQNGQIIAAPIMEFPTGVIKTLQIEVIDILDANQNQALSALLYWMTAIDKQLENATNKAEQVVALELRDSESSENSENSEKQFLYSEFKVILEESEKNIRYLIEMIDDYVAGKPHKVLEHTHP